MLYLSPICGPLYLIYINIITFGTYSYSISTTHLKSNISHHDALQVSRKDLRTTFHVVCQFQRKVTEQSIYGIGVIVIVVILVAADVVVGTVAVDVVVVVVVVIVVVVVVAVLFCAVN